MKIDKATYEDREERQNGMTAEYICPPNKVLFFADPHFLFFKSRFTNHKLPLSAILKAHPSIFLRIIIN